MPWPVRVVILLVALVSLLGVATPPVFEDHVETGFCSADCPVQHEGRGIAITSPLGPSASRGLLVVLGVLERGVAINDVVEHEVPSPARSLERADELRGLAAEGRRVQ